MATSGVRGKDFGHGGSGSGSGHAVPVKVDDGAQTDPAPTGLSSMLKSWGKKAATELKDSGHKLKIIKQKVGEKLGTSAKAADEELEHATDLAVATQRDFKALAALVKTVWCLWCAMGVCGVEKGL
jgi:hypothetical protein